MRRKTSWLKIAGLAGLCVVLIASASVSAQETDAVVIKSKNASGADTARLRVTGGVDTATVDFASTVAKTLSIENGTADPATGATGQLFYRTDLGRLRVFDGKIGRASCRERV